MKKLHNVRGVLMVVALATVAGSQYVIAEGHRKEVSAELTGFQEVPPKSTGAGADFRARIDDQARRIDFTLSYGGLEGGNPLASHIHFAQRGVNGAIIADLCGGDKPACPGATTGVVSGTITPANIKGQNPDQGIEPGAFDEFVRAIRAGMTYVNIHNARFPGGEIRGQINDRRGEGNDQD